MKEARVPDEPPDHLLVTEVLAGSRDSFAEIVVRYEARLYRHALGMVQDGEAAADLVQDTFVRAYAKLSSCKDPSRFAAWLFTILRNRCNDHLREHRRRDISLDADAPYAASGDQPDRALQRRRAGGIVEQALASLPHAQREAFLLKHVDGLSYEQMSEMLGVGVSALKMRVVRAREALRAALQTTGYGPGEEL